MSITAVNLMTVNLMTIDYSKHTAIYLGLRPDTSMFPLELNFCFLLARYYIWCCRVSKKIPILTTFLVSLKSQFRIESNNLDAVSKKWNPLLPLLSITSAPVPQKSSIYFLQANPGQGAIESYHHHFLFKLLISQIFLHC